MARSALPSFVRAVRTAALAGVPDRELLARYRQHRDEDAFAALIARHGRRVHAACRQVLHDPADIDDAFQATFVVLLNKTNAVAWDESVGGWLAAVAHRVAVHARAAARKRAGREAGWRPPAPPDPSYRDAIDVLHAELNRLPDRYRRVLLLCYLEGRSRDEAAAELATTPGAVKGRLERGREMLAARLTRRGVTLSAGLLSAVAAVPVTAGPSAELFDLTLTAAGGHGTPTVAALARGAFPMIWTLKRGIVVAVVLAGLVGVGVGVGTGPARVAATDPPKAKGPTPAPAVKTRVVGGTVIGPDGEAVSGATILVGTLPAGSKSDLDAIWMSLGTSGADGRFRREIEDRSYRPVVAATKPGFGVGWAEPPGLDRTMPTDDLTLRLAKDQDIRGRIVDTEGKPVEGLTVGVKTVIEPTGDDLTKLLTEAAQRGFGFVGQWERVYTAMPGDGIGPATTDRDGRFVLAGLGADRLASLWVAGKGYARTAGVVVTRAGVDVGPLNRKEAERAALMPVRRRGDTRVFYPPTPTVVVEPGYALEGTVTALADGKPLAGCVVQVTTVEWDRMDTTTDAAGRYRFDGMTFGMDHHVYASAPKDSPFFYSWKDVKTPAGGTPAPLDFQLAKGVTFAGRAIDKQTRQGVPASFQLIPAEGNKYAARPEYASSTRDMTWRGGREPDGRFRILHIPGPSKVNVTVAPTEKLYGQPFHPYRPGQSLTIDLPPDGGPEFTVEIDRGKTAEYTAVDAAGQPVRGLVTAGQAVWDHVFVVEPNAYRLPPDESTVPVFGLGPTEKRWLVLVQPERKLAAAVAVKPDAKEPVTLTPLQVARGRFLDADGQPLAGLKVVIDYDPRGIGEMCRDHTKFDQTATTDADGRFAVPDVIPGLPFSFVISRGKTYYAGKPRIGLKTVRPGEPLDLGDRTVEPQN